MDGDHNHAFCGVALNILQGGVCLHLFCRGNRSLVMLGVVFCNLMFLICMAVWCRARILAIPLHIFYLTLLLFLRVGVLG